MQQPSCPSKHNRAWKKQQTKGENNPRHNKIKQKYYKNMLQLVSILCTSVKLLAEELLY
jgi:hypothetical protein